MELEIHEIRTEGRMEIKIEKVEEIDVLGLSGHVGYQDNLKVRELLKMVSRKGVKALVVNLDGIENVPPLLVGSFALFNQTFARGKSSKLVFCGLNEELLEGFKLNKVSGTLPYIASQKAALNKVKAG